jgi:hypothetical protein
VATRRVLCVTADTYHRAATAVTTASLPHHQLALAGETPYLLCAGCSAPFGVVEAVDSAGSWRYYAGLGGPEQPQASRITSI